MEIVLRDLRLKKEYEWCISYYCSLKVTFLPSSGVDYFSGYDGILRYDIHLMDTPNLHLFIGENTFALGKELQRWKKVFSDKHGPENLLTLQAKECTVSDLLDAVSVMPFIAEKRLVILEGIPKIDKEEMPKILENIHPATVLLIVEPKPDKRLGIVKELEKHAEILSFPELSPGELSAWIKASLRSLGSTITPQGLQSLLDIVGTDQWTLEMELRKISSGSKSEIGVEDVERLAVPSGSQVVWKLTDLIGSKKPLEALAFLTSRIERGEEVYGMWTILLSMIKNLTLVFASTEAGIRDERSIASGTGLHFLSVRGLLPLARSMSPAQMKNLVDWVTAADIELKSGGYHYSAERPGEVIALTERAIMMTASM